MKYEISFKLYMQNDGYWNIKLYEICKVMIFFMLLALKLDTDNIFSFGLCSSKINSSHKKKIK